MENIALAVGAGRDGPEGLPWLPAAWGAWAGSSAASLVTYGHPELGQSPPARPVRPLGQSPGRVSRYLEPRQQPSEALG